MTDATITSTSPLYDLPIFGWIARQIAEDTDARIWAVLVLVVLLVAAAVATWGVVALGLIALSLVPVIYAVLLLLTVGK